LVRRLLDWSAGVARPRRTCIIRTYGRGARIRREEDVMTRITRILVPSDFSVTSDTALGYARRLAEQFEASLHLVHAFEDPFTTAAFASELYATVPLPFRQQLLDEARRRLEDRLPRADRIRFDGTAEVVTGSTAKAITEYAASISADLIVIGTHGRGGVTHLLLGSVAERVVRTAPCPVLTIRQEPAAAIKRILVPTDFSETSDEALRYAVTMAGRIGATVQLLHVLDDPLVAEGLAAEAYIVEAPTLRTGMLREAQARLAQRSDAGDPAVRIDSEVLFGHGAKTIAEYAVARGVELIVMGTHGRTGVAHLLLGSVAERLVRTAPCPVLTVRQTPQARALTELVYDVEHIPA
jgi:nucleotide-binding universal stress UspA family protein